LTSSGTAGESSIIRVSRRAVLRAALRLPRARLRREHQPHRAERPAGQQQAEQDQFDGGQFHATSAMRARGDAMGG
jgi:hypothetical protein